MPMNTYINTARNELSILTVFLKAQLLSVLYMLAYILLGSPVCTQ